MSSRLNTFLTTRVFSPFLLRKVVKSTQVTPTANITEQLMAQNTHISVRMMLGRALLSNPYNERFSANFPIP